MLQSYIPNNNTTTLVIEDTDAAYLLMFSRLFHFEVLIGMVLSTVQLDQSTMAMDWFQGYPYDQYQELFV